MLARPRTLLVALGLSAVTPALAAAQTPEDAGPIVVRAARLLDLSSGEIVRNPVVVVRGERIDAVNPADLPATDHDLDLGDVTLLPGFIDLHTHLAFQISAESFIRPVTETPSDYAYDAAGHAPVFVMKDGRVFRHDAAGIPEEHASGR